MTTKVLFSFLSARKKKDLVFSVFSFLCTFVCVGVAFLRINLFELQVRVFSVWGQNVRVGGASGERLRRTFGCSLSLCLLSLPIRPFTHGYVGTMRVCTFLSVCLSVCRSVCVCTILPVGE